ncbi:MAG: biotin--[acetyl-CoA-carboxylase] ligase [Pseudomonadota bacterium]|nr:biotin--[acetyl-CoA-carboxylase] ligase [Pseudomonadota bacterium]
MTTERFRHIRLDDVGSTNDEARSRMIVFPGEEFVVTGVRQLSGRGRRGRTWVSPEGNVYASFLIRAQAPTGRLPELSFVAALAVAEAASAFVDPPGRVRCKWPNDVLVDGAKVSGILLETATDTSGKMVVIAGIGINVATKPSDTPYPAVALSACSPEASVDGVFTMLRASLTTWLQTWETHGFAPVRAAWLGLADGVGEPVVVRLADGELHGRFAGLDESGALILEMPQGDVRRITAGDVFRPAQARQGESDAAGH